MQTSFEPPGTEAIHIATQRATSLRSLFRGPRYARAIATTTALTPVTPDAGALNPGAPEAVPSGDRSGPVSEPGPPAPKRSAFALPRRELSAPTAGRRRVDLVVALLVVALVSGVALTWPQIRQRDTNTDSTRAATVPVNAAPPPLLATTPSPTVTGSADPTSSAPTVATHPPATQASPAKPAPRNNRDLAAGAKMTSSGHQDVYVESNANDGGVDSYWESTNNAFPVWLQVDVGAPARVQRIELAVPPSPLWLKRTQTLSVQGSTDGSSFRTVLAPADYSFDPANANRVTIKFNATNVRYLRLTFTANTAWPAGQISTFSVYAS
jgi:hypothetical protein